jgi:hypothetical protein
MSLICSFYCDYVVMLCLVGVNLEMEMYCTMIRGEDVLGHEEEFLLWLRWGNSRRTLPTLCLSIDRLSVPASLSVLIFPFSGALIVNCYR